MENEAGYMFVEISKVKPCYKQKVILLRHIGINHAFPLHSSDPFVLCF